MHGCSMDGSSKACPRYQVLGNTCKFGGLTTYAFFDTDDIHLCLPSLSRHLALHDLAFTWDINGPTREPMLAQRISYRLLGDAQYLESMSVSFPTARNELHGGREIDSYDHYDWVFPQTLSFNLRCLGGPRLHAFQAPYDEFVELLS